MELSSSQEEASCGATLELFSILWKVQSCVHKGPPMVSILTQINPVNNISYYLSKILLIRLHLGLSSGFFLSAFPTNNL
jgi:hypothetical protein